MFEVPWSAKGDYMKHNHNFLTKLGVQCSLRDTTLSVTEIKHGMFEIKNEHDSCKAVIVLN